MLNKFKENRLFMVLLLLTVVYLACVFLPFDFPYKVLGTNGTTEQLHNGDEIIESVNLNSYLTRSIVLREAGYMQTAHNVNLSLILTQQDNIIASKEITADEMADGSYISIDIPKQYQRLNGNYLLTIKVNTINDSDILTLYQQKSDKNFVSYNLNGTNSNNSLFIIINGYSKNFLLAWIILAIISIIFIFYFRQKNDKKIYFKKYWIALYFLISLFFSILVMYLTNTSHINIIVYTFYILLLPLIAIMVSTIDFYFSHYNNKIENLFLIIAIPIGIFYTFAIMPFEVPDSQFHYVSAYNLTIGNINQKSAFVPKIMSENFYSVSQSYKDYSTLVQLPYDNNDNVSFDRATYNFLDYLPASCGIFIAKLFNLSPYLGAYLAKFMTFLTYLIFGFIILKIIPFAKKIMMVYIMSPIFLQQATSFSIDAMINFSALYFISKILNLKFQKKKISYFDIIFLCLSLIFCSIQKSIYLPLGLLVLLLKEKINIKSNYKLKHFTFMCGFIVLSIIMFNFFLNSQVSLNSINNGFLSYGQYFKSDPFKFFLILLNTIITFFNSYIIEASIGVLGWSSIHLPETLSCLYLLTFLIGVFSEENIKEKFSKNAKFCIFNCFLIISILIFFALYYTWSPLGSLVILGVQGRYFIPINFLIVLLILNSKKYVLQLKNSNIIICLLIIGINCFTLIHLINLF
jgi:uncharacterized membrane protein